MADTDTQLKRWRRIKQIAALFVFGAIIASVCGTALSMLATFNAFAADNAPISPDEMADEISQPLLIGFFLMPFILLGIVVYLIAVLRVRKMLNST